MEVEGGELERKLTRLNSKVRKLKARLKAANHRIDDLEKENHALTENSIQLSSRLQTLQSEYDALKQPISLMAQRDGNSSSSRSYESTSHSLTLKKLSSQALHLKTTLVNSASSFAPPNDPIHQMPKLLAPSRSPTSPYSSHTQERKPSLSKVSFSDRVTTIEAPKRQRKSKKRNTQLSEIIPDALSTESSGQISIQDNSLSLESYREASDIVEKMRNYESLSELQIMAFAEMYFDKHPIILEFIANQPLNINFGSSNAAHPSAMRDRANSEGSSSTALFRRSNLFSSPTLPQESEDNHLDSWIRFNMPTPRKPTELFKSPCFAFQEQSDVLRFINCSSSEIYVNINTFPCQGAFLGFSMSRSRLLPQQDCRINLALVGNAIKTCNALLLISLVPKSERPATSTIPSSSDTSDDPPCSQYYAFSCEVQMTKPKLELSYWKFSLAELKEHANEFSRTSMAIVSSATLQGAMLSCRKFISQSNVLDFGFFSRFLEIAYRLPSHPNLISVIGASDRRPYRILSPPWTCTLSVSLMATCSRGSLEASEVGGEFPALNVLNSFSQGGELRSWLNSHDAPRDAPLLADLHSRLVIAQDILAAVKELHAHQLIHRDLSTSSFGLCNESCAILVELSSCLEMDGKFVALPPSPQRWNAPETSSAGGHTYESDIYSIGVILLDLAVGAPLSTTIAARGFATFDEVFIDWQNFLDSSNYSQSNGVSETSAEFALTSGAPLQRLATLIRYCCSPTPSTRPSLDIISNHLNSIVEASRSFP